MKLKTARNLMFITALLLFLVGGIAFAGEARVSWIAPTKNTDGTPLTNLAGYRIYYGASAASLTQVVDVADPTATAYTVVGLADGTWYFALRSYNAAGKDSALSNVANKTIVTPPTPNPPTNVTISSIGLTMKLFPNGFLHLALAGQVAICGPA